MMHSKENTPIIFGLVITSLRYASHLDEIMILNTQLFIRTLLSNVYQKHCFTQNTVIFAVIEIFYCIKRNLIQPILKKDISCIHIIEKSRSQIQLDSRAQSSGLCVLFWNRSLKTTLPYLLGRFSKGKLKLFYHKSVCVVGKRVAIASRQCKQQRSTTFMDHF